MLKFIENVFSFFGSVGETLKEFVIKVSDYIDFILNLPSYLPTPFKEILLSFIGVISIILIIRFILKIKGVI